MSGVALTAATALEVAYEQAKHLFLQRNYAHCAYLQVNMLRDSDDDVVLVANFALGPARDWRTIETRIDQRQLRDPEQVPAQFERAFGRLDDAISAARIARLFGPLPVARRMAIGRA